MPTSPRLPGVVRHLFGEKGPRGPRAAATLLLILIAWVVRVHRLGSHPLWVDEAFSLWIARLALPHLMAKTAQIDQHPPLYYLTLKAWTTLVGPSEWAMRSMSAFWGTLTVPLMYATSRRFLRDARAALLAAALVALSPFHVRYAQDARMYTLLALWGLAALCVVGMGYGPHLSPLARWQLGRGVRGEGRDLSAILLGTLMALAALTHGLGLLVPLTATLVLLITRAPRRRALVALATFALLWLPWLPAYLQQTQGVVRRFWVPWPTWRDVWGALHTFHAASMPGPFWLRWGVDIGFLLLAGVGIRGMARTVPGLHPSPPGRRDPAPTAGARGVRWEGGPRVALTLAVFWLAPVIVTLALSPLRPVFQPRVLIWATFPYYILIAAGVARLTLSRARGLAPLAAAIVLLVQVLGLRGWYATPPPERWDQAVAIVQAHARPNDLLLFNAAWTQLPFDYYATRADLTLERHGVPVDIARADTLEPLTTPADVARIERLTRGRGRVWLIYSHDWYTDPQGITRHALERHFTLARAWELPGIRMMLYGR